MSQEKNNISSTLINELFNDNRYNDLFMVANEVNRRLREQKELLNSFQKLLNLDNIKNLISHGKMRIFLDEIIPFLSNDKFFTESEKKSFLNGCENILFLHSLINNKYDYAEKLNEYRLDKTLFINREFLLKNIREKNIDIILKLLDFSTDNDFEESKIIKMLFSNDCKDYSFIKHLINNYNLNINAIGNLGLTYEAKGSFSHLVFMSKETMFFNCFIKDFGESIDFNNKLIIKNKEFSLIDIILSNVDLTLEEKISRFTKILNYGNLNERNIVKISDILSTEEIVSEFYGNHVYEALFSNIVFNNKNIRREKVINNILKLDNTEIIKKVRRNKKINPITIILSKFINLSSPINKKELHPVNFWLRYNKENKFYEKDTLLFLLKNYKNEINDLDINHFKLQPRILEILEKNGFIKDSKYIFYFFKKEPKYKNEENKNNQKLLIQNYSFKEETILNMNTSITKQITDKDILLCIQEINNNIEQYGTLTNNKISKEFGVFKEKIQNQITKIIENFLVLNDNDIKESTLSQLNFLKNKTFELIEKFLNIEKKQKQLQLIKK